MRVLREPFRALAGAVLTAACAAAALGSSPAPADDPLRVVVTIPDLKDIAERVGGERVTVFSVARGTENVHAVRVRPSDLVQVNRADLFVQVGLSLEHAYVPGLLESGRNRDVQPGSPGFVNAAEGWEAVDVPEEISRGRAADIHPQGNPHVNLSLRGGRFLAGRVLAGLVRVDPESEPYYRERHAAYERELERAEARWAERAEALAGRKAVAYHSTYRYFARDTGLEIVDHVEPKPGVPPAAGDLARIIERMEQEDVRLLLTPRWSNDDSVRFVAERTGARVVELPSMVLAEGQPGTWIGLIDALFDRIEAALE